MAPKSAATDARPDPTPAKRPDSSTASDVELATRERYAKATVSLESNLCCAHAEYPTDLIANVPEAIRQVDYGCGDPTRWAVPGDIALDLGSGSGKACYLLAQIVGPEGAVVGVDFNPPMLELARSGLEEFHRTTGLGNVEFLRGRIQDLALDLDRLDAWLADHPVSSAADLQEMEAEMVRLRRSEPLIESESIDLIISNCVLNLARDEEKEQLFREMHRVLQRGGRCVISDIVCDEPVPERLKGDAELWSGCLSGAMQERRFMEAFEQAGFHGIEILTRQRQPWQVVEGIEFRSVTVRAFKGKRGPCIERNQAVVYHGPWRAVQDDDGHTLIRGERMAVCEKTFNIMTSEPYRDQVSAVEPLVRVEGKGEPFDCNGSKIRHPHETKSGRPRETRLADSDACCDPDLGCC